MAVVEEADVLETIYEFLESRGLFATRWMLETEAARPTHSGE
jgi:hypothetical protein